MRAKGWLVGDAVAMLMMLLHATRCVVSVVLLHTLMLVHSVVIFGSRTAQQQQHLQQQRQWQRWSLLGMSWLENQ